MRQLRVSSATNPQSLHPVSSWRRLCREGQEVHSSRSVYHPGDHYPLHRHDYGECTIIIHGSIALTQATDEQELNRGSVVLIHPDFEHGFHNRGNTACNWSISPFPWQPSKPWRSVTLIGHGECAAGSACTTVQSIPSAINHWPEELKQDRNNRLKADACLLHIQSQLDATDHDALPLGFGMRLSPLNTHPILGWASQSSCDYAVVVANTAAESCAKKRELPYVILSMNDALLCFVNYSSRKDSSIEHLSTQVWHNSPAQLFRLFKDKYGTSPAPMAETHPGTRSYSYP